MRKNKFWMGRRGYSSFPPPSPSRMEGEKEADVSRLTLPVLGVRTALYCTVHEGGRRSGPEEEAARISKGAARSTQAPTQSLLYVRHGRD